MRIRHFATLSVLLLTTGSAWAGFSSRITGTITDQDGNPIAGVTVRAFRESLGSFGLQDIATTAADGSYTAFVPGGNYVLEYTKDGSGFLAELYHDGSDFLCPPETTGTSAPRCLATGATRVNVPDSDTTVTGIDEDLKVGAAVWGTVNPGSPLAGVETTLFSAPNAIAVIAQGTSDEGRYFLVVPGQQDYFVRADGSGQGRLSALSAQDCGTDCYAVGQACPLGDLRCELGSTIAAGADPVSTADGAYSRVDFVLQRGHAISGTVLEDDATTPIAGAQVSVWTTDGAATNATASTAADGSYTTFPPLPGSDAGSSYALSASRAEFESELYQELACDADGTCDPTLGTAIGLSGDVAGIDFTLTPRRYTIAGIVRDADTAARLSGATVCIVLEGSGNSPDCSTTTSGLGAYTTPAVRAGSYAVTASQSGYTPATRLVTVAAGTGDRTGQNLNLALQRGGVAGTARLEGQGAHISGLRIAVTDLVGDPVAEVLTGNDGTYQFANLPTGNYLLFADGGRRGFVSEVYAGRDDLGDLVEVVCTDDNDCGTRVFNGLPVVVSDATTAVDIDFELAPGDILSPASLNELDRMGAAVALCGARAAIGLPGDDEAGPEAGAVLVYVREGTGYVFSQKLLPSPLPADGERFGSALDCDGETLIVGAPADGAVAKTLRAKGAASSAAAYMMSMKGDTANPLGKLIAANFQQGDDSGWGSAVAIDGGSIAIGAPGSNGSGAVVMMPVVEDFDPQLAVTLTDPQANQGAGFGSALDMSAGKVVVGAPSQANPLNGSLSGTAHLFENISGSNDWSTLGKFVNAGAQGGDGFGAAVAMDGSMMAVGAPGADLGGTDAGAAHVFRFGGDELVAVGGPITSLEAGPGAGFGSSVSLVGETLAVGAPAAADGDGVKSGKGLMFQLGGGTWDQIAEAASSSGEVGELFGISIAFDGANLVVGAPGGTRFGVAGGFAQTFVIRDSLYRDGFD